MLELEFELSGDDYAAYNLFVLNRLPAGIRQFRTFRISFTLLVALASFALIVFGFGDLVGGLIAGAIAAAAMWLLSRWSWDKQVRSNVRRMSRDDGLGTPGR
ncbi:MAG: hypothetical protein U1E29_10265, partial [Coriobacteriia bacterium]|nr:hypothetical protein [Coriobacteriia bacterium]